MAKKKKNKSRSRRVPRSSASRMYGDGKQRMVQSPAVTESVSASSAPRTAPASHPRTTAVATEEYRYVVADLRRLGILSAATFVVLIILGFIIR